MLNWRVFLLCKPKRVRLAGVLAVQILFGTPVLPKRRLERIRLVTKNALVANVLPDARKSLTLLTSETPNASADGTLDSMSCRARSTAAVVASVIAEVAALMCEMVNASKPKARPVEQDGYAPSLPYVAAHRRKRTVRSMSQGRREKGERCF